MTTTLFRLALAGLGLSLSLMVPAANAAEGVVKAPKEKWSFDGPIGKFDRAQLQRGYKVYKEVCANCHAASLVRFRNLSQPGGPEFTTGQIAALAATYQIKDGPNDQGEMFDRPGRPADAFPSPFPNEQAARAANGGAYPPDMSVLAKAREQGPDYIHAILNGYKDEAPAGITLQPGQYYNEYMPGHLIAMPKPISDGQVEFPKGADGKAPVPETVEQYSRDVAAFMMWMAEPHLEARKRLGMQVMIFLALFAVLLYYTKKKVWARMPDGSPVH